jgi:LPS O-antigen subunit length determinant protein (WzzB/FepE family)
MANSLPRKGRQYKPTAGIELFTRTERTVDIRGIEKYAKLTARKRALDNELTQVKAQMAELQESVLSYFQSHGMERTTVGGETLYIRRELWVSYQEDADREAAIGHLHALGMEEMAPHRLNTQRISAWAREREKEGLEAIPGELKPYLKASETFKIGARSAS